PVPLIIRRGPSKMRGDFYLHPSPCFPIPDSHPRTASLMRHLGPGISYDRHLARVVKYDPLLPGSTAGENDNERKKEKKGKRIDIFHDSALL
ncbi:MAG: hypothetical protein WCR65_03955, partial [Parcubacteria group bacterium]